jgi:hypothetical protein
MTSIIKVNTIQDVGGNNLLISNGSGTITTNNIGGQNTPAFNATLSSAMTSIAQNTWITITADTEVLDTNSNYNTTNYTFTPTVAGKYYVFCNLRIADISSGTYAYFRFYKNNSTVEMLGEHYVASHGSSQNNTELTLNGLKIIDFNGSSDSIVCQVRTTTSSGADIKSGNEESNWGAYRIIGA